MGDHVPRAGALDRADRHAACRPRAQQIAWGAIGRRAIRLDPRWRGGDYYDAAPGDGPAEGLAIARMVAQVTFRSDNVFTDRFGRELADQAAVGDTFGLWQQFEVERYLEHHGDKLGPALRRQQLPRSSARRWTSTTSPAAAAAWRRRWPGSRVPDAGDRHLAATCSTRPTSSARSTSCSLGRGLPSSYVEIDSPHGHDAFLINLDQVGEPIAKFLGRVG